MYTAKRRNGATDGTDDRIIGTPQSGVITKTNIVSDPSRTTVVDNERVGAEYLLKYSEGAPWVVTWYKFVRGINDIHTFFDFEVDDPTQQIEVVYNLPLLVLSAVDPSQDTTSKSFELRGESTVPLSFDVNENDFFIADIGQNRKGIFVVNETYRYSVDKEGLLRINYSMISLCEEHHQEALERSTIREYYYAIDRVGLGYSPLLSPTEWNRWLNIDQACREIEGCYIDLFYNQECRTLVIPDQDEYVYDPFLVRFVKALGFSKYPNEITQYSLDPIKEGMLFTVWRTLYELTTRYDRKTYRELAVYPTSSFRRTERHNTIYYSHINSVVMHESQISRGSETSIKLSEVAPAEVYKGNRVELKGLPIFGKVTMSPYLVSDEYYSGKYVTVLEYAMRQMVERKPLDQEVALILANDVFNLNNIETYYYMPIVYVLLKYSRGLQ